MKQTLVKISWPEGVNCSPSQFREKLAKSNLFSSDFFHYGTEVDKFDVKKEFIDGRLKVVSKIKVTKVFDKPIPLNGRPPIRIIGGKHWVGVIADPGAESLLLPQVGSILKVATDVAQSPVKMEIEQREFSISYTENPIKYMLREMAVCRRNMQSRNAELDLLVANRIFGGVSGDSHYGIDGICAQFNFEPPERAQLEIKVFPLRNIGLHNKSSDGLSKEYVSLVDAEVWMNAKIEGVWQVGNLTARGYGRLIKPLGKSS